MVNSLTIPLVVNGTLTELYPFARGRPWGRLALQPPVGEGGDLEGEQDVRIGIGDLLGDGLRRERVDQMGDDRQARGLLVVSAYADPRGRGRRGPGQHLVARLGVGVPPLLGGGVEGR